MGVAFTVSFVFILFFITKPMAIVMSVASTDDTNPLTHADNNTTREHDKSHFINYLKAHAGYIKLAKSLIHCETSNIIIPLVTQVYIYGKKFLPHNEQNCRYIS